MIRKLILLGCIILSIPISAHERGPWYLIGRKPDSNSYALICTMMNCPVVPGAFGFGMQTRAAYGSTDPDILRVTNVNDSGSGSLRAALEASGPRVVIFEISGNIPLTTEIVITDPYITVAGQTAPSPGITLQYYGIQIQTHDVLIQHLRIRPGGNNCNIAIEAFQTGNPYNIVLDHLSVSWSQSKNYVFTNSMQNMDLTVWRNISSEPLYAAPGTGGCPSGGFGYAYGMLFRNNAKNAAVLETVFAHNSERNPELSGSAQVYSANNIIYDWMTLATLYEDPDGAEPPGLLGSHIGNYYKTGPSTDPNPRYLAGSRYLVSGAEVYIADTTVDYTGVAPTDFVVIAGDGIDPRVGTAPITVTGYTPAASSGILTSVLANAGARPADRDSVDTRIASEVMSRTGAIIATQADVGGWPSLAENTRALTTPASPHAISSTGYTNLENWLHDYADAIEQPPAQQVTSFYVDAARTSSGAGTAVNPWKLRTDIDWSAVTTALSSGPVNIYFSSQASWTGASYLIVPSNTNTTSNRLTLDGHSKYNTVTSGTANWQNEVIAGNRATLDQTLIVDHDINSFITIKGFNIVGAASGGIALGQNNPTLNMHDIVIENNIIDTPTSNHGVWFGYAETGCYNITVRNNTISSTPSEGIYIGHYSYLSNTIINTLVEGNTLINTGDPGPQGDIDIKAGNFGAIIRYNTTYSTGTGQVHAGIVISSSDAQVYGNTIHNLLSGVSADGEGITVNGDQGDAGGKTLNNVIIYNNLIYSNYGNGISAFATATGAAIVDLKVLNNSIVGETNGHGFHASASGPGSISVAALVNNIFSGNNSYEIWASAGVTFTSANYNVIYHPAGGTYLNYQGVDKSYAQWQTLGFEANGVNTNPTLNGSYVPSIGSPATGAGATRSEFTIDKNQAARIAPWTIGAFNGL